MKTKGKLGQRGTLRMSTRRGNAGANAASAAVEDQLEETIVTQSSEIEKLTSNVGGLTGEVLNLEDSLTASKARSATCRPK